MNSTALAQQPEAHDRAHAPATRVLTSLTGPLEKRALIWMARRLPRAVNSDHLTALALVSMFGAGLSYWLASRTPWGLLLASVCLAINWFGDSLDGTVARVRRCERPRYGYYVDHVLDAIGFGALFGGLVLGGFMSPLIGLGFLSAYYLLVAEISMATHARGTFRMSFGQVGPTELRILLAVGTLQLMRSAFVTPFGHSFLLFDVGGAVGIAGLLLTFVVSAVSNGVALYKEERLPPAARVNG